MRNNDGMIDPNDPNTYPGIEVIPEHMRGGVVRYIMQGIPGGGFQNAIFANDFMGACGKADWVNIRNLKLWGEFLYNYAPYGCHGSYEKVEQWCQKGGLLGHGVSSDEQEEEAKAGDSASGDQIAE